MKLPARLYSLLLSHILFFNGCAYSQNSNTPYDMLGMSVSDLKKMMVLETITFLYDEDIITGWYYNDANGRGFTLLDENGDQIIDTFSTKDELYVTQGGISIGDRLDRVLEAYNDSEIYIGSTGEVQVKALSGKIVFVFDSIEIDIIDVISSGDISVSRPEIATAILKKIEVSY